MHGRHSMRSSGQAVRLKQELAMDHVVWLTIHGNLWWPSQVVDEGNVSKKRKPKKKREGDVLVRLYGSYEYLYVNPTNYHSKFEKFLKQNNCSSIEAFQMSLEKDLSKIKLKDKLLKKKAFLSQDANNGIASRGKTGKNRKKADGEGDEDKDAMNKDLIVNEQDNQGTPRKKQKKDRTMLDSADCSIGKSKILSIRRVRVMQNLGLIAPLGSPF